MEVGSLKRVCDANLPALLAALDAFDDAVAASLVDSQATRSINSSYELALDAYLKQERSYYERAAQDAEAALNEVQSSGDPRQRELAERRYKRSKQRLVQIGQRRQLYEARLRAAEMNQQVRGVIREKIRGEGHSVATAGNRDEALALLRGQDFDLAVLDIQLDQESGLELLQEIANERERLPVILCTAYSCYKEDFSSWLADAYVVKSSDLNELKNEIRRILEQKPS